MVCRCWGRGVGDGGVGGCGVGGGGGCVGSSTGVG